MEFADLDFAAKIFTQGDLVSIARADDHTINNWIKHGHLDADRVGGRRMFSASDIVAVDLMVMMQDGFKIRPEVSSVIAASAIKSYEFFERDRAEIASGKDWQALSDHRGDAHWELTRDADGTLRATEKGDRQSEGVMIVLPVRIVARSALAKIKIWSEAIGE